MRTRLMLAAVAAIMAPAAAGAQAFSNGSFETGVSPGTFITLSGGSTDITGWVVTGGSIDYIGDYWQPDTGARSVDLNGISTGGLAQTFDTILGQRYSVGFSLAGNPDGLPTTKTVVTLASGGSTQSDTFDATGSTRAAMNWQDYSYSFVASGTSTTLSFTSQDAGSFGAALDSVSVMAVPEPATWGMMILGFGLIGGVARRRTSRRLAIA